jgi:hypothetical protein
MIKPRPFTYSGKLLGLYRLRLVREGYNIPLIDYPDTHLSVVEATCPASQETVVLESVGGGEETMVTS